MKNLSFISLALMLHLGCFSQETTFVAAMLDSAAIRFQDKWGIPGMSIAVTKDGRLIHAKGFGYADTSLKEPVSTKSQFRIASCSKTITALGVMKLMEENKLRLDDPVFGSEGILKSQAYSEIADSQAYQITVRHLLQQSVGWPQIDILGENHASYALNARIPAGTEENVKYVLSLPQDYAPGTAYRYSDFNYFFLGEIISQIAQQPQELYITEKILTPIGAINTCPGQSARNQKQIHEVVYYDYNGETAPSAFDTSNMVPMSYSYNMIPMLSSGGWISTPTDMLRIIMAMDGLEEPEDLVSEETIKIMSSPPIAFESKYAMGMKVNKAGDWHHGGQCTWGTTALWFKRNDNLSFAIFCNTLPTTGETEEEKYQGMTLHFIDMIRLVTNCLDGIDSYPNMDLFVNPQQ